MTLRHRYQATFVGDGETEGKVACPACGSTLLHPTGHSRTLPIEEEYGPVIGVVARCECGESVEIALGNYKGDLGIDVRRL